MGKYDFDLELYNENPLNWIAAKVTESSRVLEFGPANGRLTRYLKENKGCVIDIVEIDEESGEEASEYAKKALIGNEKGDIEKYYWLDIEEKYDFIIFADVLEHLVNPWEVLKRCKKVIHQNGKILVSVPNVAHNSIIIDLMNDRFTYNPTGLLDNTHLRFFTRESFERMAQREGWAIVEEKTNNIRVGETEIDNTYADVSKEVFKVLASRPQGNVYQYMFALALSTEYLKGNCDRIVSLDSTSYYHAEVQYERNGSYDYQKCITRQIAPHNRELKMEFDIMENSKGAVVYPLSCNCVLEVGSVTVSDIDGASRVIEFSHNGVAIGNRIYFVYGKPELKVNFNENDKKLKLDIIVCKYDFEDETYVELMNTLLYEQQHIRQVCDDYEKVISQINQERKKSIIKRLFRK